MTPKECGNVADSGLQLKPFLGGFSEVIGSTTIAEAGGFRIISMAFPPQSRDALSDALLRTFDLEMPEPGNSISAPGTRLVWMAPGQLILMLENPQSDMERILPALAHHTHLIDHSDNWAMLLLSGHEAVLALERICPLDLHPAAFPTGAAARTLMEHLGIVIIRTGATEFLLLSASSSARSFLHAVRQSLVNVT